MRQYFSFFLFNNPKNDNSYFLLLCLYRLWWGAVPRENLFFDPPSWMRANCRVTLHPQHHEENSALKRTLKMFPYSCPNIEKYLIYCEVLNSTDGPLFVKIYSSTGWIELGRHDEGWVPLNRWTLDESKGGWAKRWKGGRRMNGKVSGKKSGWQEMVMFGQGWMEDVDGWKDGFDEQCSESGCSVWGRKGRWWKFSWKKRRIL